MKITKEQIASLIPQRYPFVMIDNLLEADMQGFETDFFVSEENIFIKNRFLTEPALIENIAQTCAAGFGFIRQQAGEELRTGFIGAVSKLLLHRFPELHSTIHTKVKVLHQLENIFLVKGENFCGVEKLLECEMKIVIH